MLQRHWADVLDAFTNDLANNLAIILLEVTGDWKAGSYFQ